MSKRYEIPRKYDALIVPCLAERHDGWARFAVSMTADAIIELLEKSGDVNHDTHHPEGVGLWRGLDMVEVCGTITSMLFPGAVMTDGGFAVLGPCYMRGCAALRVSVEVIWERRPDASIQLYAVLYAPPRRGASPAAAFHIWGAVKER